MVRKLIYFGTCLPEGSSKPEEDLKFYEFNKSQMKRLSVSGKPHCDEHNQTPMGCVLMSWLGSENGNMYIIGEVTNEKLIDEIQSGTKLGLSLRHDYKLIFAEDGGSIEFKTLTEVSSTTKPLRDGQYILTHIIVDETVPTKREGVDIGIPSNSDFRTENQLDRNISTTSSQVSASPELQSDLVATLSKPVMSEIPAAVAENAEETTIENKLASPQDFKALVELLIELNEKNKALEADVGKSRESGALIEAAQKRISDMENERDAIAKQYEELQTASKAKTEYDIGRLIANISDLAKDVGQPDNSLTASDFMGASNPAQFHKFTDTIAAVAAAAHAKIATLEADSDMIEEIKRKRKRVTSPPANATSPSISTPIPKTDPTSVDVRLSDYRRVAGLIKF